MAWDAVIILICLTLAAYFFWQSTPQRMDAWKAAYDKKHAAFLKRRGIPSTQPASTQMPLTAAKLISIRVAKYVILSMLAILAMQNIDAELGRVAVIVALFAVVVLDVYDSRV